VRVALATAVALAAGAPLLAVAPAWASGLEVVPVQVGLSKGAPNALVSLKNDSPEDTRYQVELFAWGERRDGTMELSPSKDLVIFPGLFTLKPGEQRNLRVGALPTLFAPVEHTYRLFIQELPPETRPQGSVGVRVLTRIGIPVFLAPVTPPAVHYALTDVSTKGGKLSFTLRNGGNVHLRPAAVQAIARGGEGDVIADRKWDSWYVLAGGERVYQAPLPTENCKQVRVVGVEVALEKESLKSSIQTPHGTCSP
jgi:fimbrial chaperone protein